MQILKVQFPSISGRGVTVVRCRKSVLTLDRREVTNGETGLFVELLHELTGISAGYGDQYDSSGRRRYGNSLLCCAG